MKLEHVQNTIEHIKAFDAYEGFDVEPLLTKLAIIEFNVKHGMTLTVTRSSKLKFTVEYPEIAGLTRSMTYKQLIEAYKSTGYLIVTKDLQLQKRLETDGVISIDGFLRCDSI